MATYVQTVALEMCLVTSCQEGSVKGTFWSFTAMPPIPTLDQLKEYLHVHQKHFGTMTTWQNDNRS